MKSFSDIDQRKSPFRSRSPALKINENPFVNRSSSAEKMKGVANLSSKSKSSDEQDVGLWNCTDDEQGLGHWKCANLPSSEVNLSDEEINLMTGSFAQLPSVNLADVAEPVESSENPMKTPLYFSQCNLQSGLLESIGQDPHYQYMEVPVSNISPTLDQINLFASHVKNASIELSKTAASLDNQSRNTAQMMVKANDMATSLANQVRAYEHNLQTLTIKMDVIGDGMKIRGHNTDYFLREINRKLDLFDERLTILSQRQQSLLGEMFQTQMMVDMVFKACRSIPGFQDPHLAVADPAPVPANDPPLHNFIPQANADQ